MQKINSATMVGLIGGLAANYVKVRVEQVAERNKLHIHSTSRVQDYGLAALLGLSITQALRYSGPQYSLLKGIVLGNVGWTAIRALQRKKPSSLPCMLAQSAFGAMCATFHMATNKRRTQPKQHIPLRFRQVVSPRV